MSGDNLLTVCLPVLFSGGDPLVITSVVFQVITDSLFTYVVIQVTVHSVITLL